MLDEVKQIEYQYLGATHPVWGVIKSYGIWALHNSWVHEPQKSILKSSLGLDCCDGDLSQTLCFCFHARKTLFLFLQITSGRKEKEIIASHLKNKNNGPQNILLLHAHIVFSECVVFPRAGGFRGWMSWNNPWWWGCEAGERLIKTAGSLVSRNPCRGLGFPLVSYTFSPSGLRWSARMSCINLKAVGPVDLIAPQERQIQDLFICGHALGVLFLLSLLLYTSLYKGNDRIIWGKRKWHTGN